MNVTFEHSYFCLLFYARVRYLSTLAHCLNYGEYHNLYGLKFFYTKVLGKTWDDIPLIKSPKATRIPDILTIEQLNELFTATITLSYKVFFFTIYSMGLRLGEGIKLTVEDIDSKKMRVHIRDAKGNKDRFTPLPENTLHILKNFWAPQDLQQYCIPIQECLIIIRIFMWSCLGQASTQKPDCGG